MTNHPAYDAIEQSSMPLMSHYQSDLEIDREVLNALPANTPFLHFTREMGTHLVTLPEASTYPARGELVPYLFGKADREHVLREKLSVIEHFENKYNSPCLQILYWTGQELRVLGLALGKARQVIEDYQKAIRANWEAS